MPMSRAVNKIHENDNQYSQTMDIIINCKFWIIYNCEYDYVTSLKGLMTSLKGLKPVNLVTLAAMSNGPHSGAEQCITKVAKD